MVNGQRIKHYISGDPLEKDVDIIQVVTPEEFIKNKYRKDPESELEYVSVPVSKLPRKIPENLYSLFLGNIINYETKKRWSQSPGCSGGSWLRPRSGPCLGPTWSP